MLKVRLITAESYEYDRAVAEAERRANEFLATPAIIARDARTAISEHTTNPEGGRLFVCVVTITYEQLVSIG
jgi:hypothetical protein